MSCEFVSIIVVLDALHVWLHHMRMRLGEGLHRISLSAKSWVTTAGYPLRIVHRFVLEATIRIQPYAISSWSMAFNSQFASESNFYGDFLHFFPIFFGFPWASRERNWDQCDWRESEQHNLFFCIHHSTVNCHAIWDSRSNCDFLANNWIEAKNRNTKTRIRDEQIACKLFEFRSNIVCTNANCRVIP